MGIIDQPARRAKVTRELTEPAYNVSEERALLIIEVPPAPRVTQNLHTVQPECHASEEACQERKPWWKLW